MIMKGKELLLGAAGFCGKLLADKVGTNSFVGKTILGATGMTASSQVGGFIAQALPAMKVIGTTVTTVLTSPVTIPIAACAVVFASCATYGKSGAPCDSDELDLYVSAHTP